VGLQNVDSLETLAVGLLAAGKVPDAVSRYEDVIHKPSFGSESQEVWFQSHLALGRLYEREGRLDDARRLYTSLADRWKNADASLPLLKAVRERLAKL